MKARQLSIWSIMIVSLLLFWLLGRSTAMQAAPEQARISPGPNTVGIVGDPNFDLLSPGYSQIAHPGDVVTYTHVLTNVNTTTDTVMLAATSSQGWPVELWGASGTLSLPVQLDAGLTTTVRLQLTLPSSVISGTVDTAVITATSQTSPTLTGTSVDTTTAQNIIRYVYLPLFIRRWPPVPEVPVLNAIDNADGDGNYTVNWNTAALADTYTLQESAIATFSSPTVRYAGPDTTWLASGKAPGRYYYRVKASNVWGDGGWSNVQSAFVRPPSTFYSVGDSDILQGYASSNTGSDTSMWAGYDDYLNPDGKIARSLIKFDTSVIPPGTSISGAVLQVYLVSSYDYPGTTRTITTYRIGSGWSEYAVTWNTAPSMGEAYGATGVTHGAWGWFSFDVTNLVRGWINGTLPNYGVMLRGPEWSGSDSSWKAFSTREGPYPPQLIITYSGLSMTEAEASRSISYGVGMPKVNIQPLDHGRYADLREADVCTNDAGKSVVRKCLGFLP